MSSVTSPVFMPLPVHLPVGTISFAPPLLPLPLIIMQATITQHTSMAPAASTSSIQSA